MTTKEIQQAENILTGKLQLLEGLDLARDVAYYQKIEIVKTYHSTYDELSGMITFLGKMGYDCAYHPKDETHKSFFTIEKSLFNI